MEINNLKNSEVKNIHAEINKIMAETIKINAEARFHPIIVLATVVCVFVTLVKLFS